MAINIEKLVLEYIKSISIPIDETCTVAEISKALHINPDVLKIVLRRLEHWRCISVFGGHYSFISTEKVYPSAANSQSLRNKAWHLLNVIEPLSMTVMSDILKIGPAECLELMAYLVRANKAQVLDDCVITTLPKNAQ